MLRDFFYGPPFENLFINRWVFRPVALDKTTLLECLDMIRELDPSATFRDGTTWDDSSRPVELSPQRVAEATAFDLRGLVIEGERVSVSFAWTAVPHITVAGLDDRPAQEMALRVLDKLVNDGSPRVQWRRRVVPLAPFALVPVAVALLAWLVRSVELPAAAWTMVVAGTVATTAAAIRLLMDAFPLQPVLGEVGDVTRGYTYPRVAILEQNRREVQAARINRHANIIAGAWGALIGAVLATISALFVATFT